ncbi:MAG: prepilin-type N-terminal cleavage/methylation domain-containing protein [Arenicellales bacterium]|jgi:prepilin-type N-terminal cleavage/methylation domain-containing protein|nr:prepilin-type N-terminal cleavage/methylation domain-containing protein [Arenicellales bacterium]MDP6289338.1 prepilin-type N-terminal cleavage/methylation domain-containing protein [Arenicellales bacterium]MDP7156527.1 prepilin-type N-terminal cleavage/methylation domain-containing protein [Arenicellales bacterium]HJP26853.1 prepilin-type N-terminal cleavage/methylation domain-containing protein [Arenicellales bacterium]|tara:strand:+ start:7784 stop:8332 length:549 start_codon:yes stop_codon:yes gene_type:complete
MGKMEQGLTLLELIVVVAIIAIIGFFGFPAMDGWQSGRRVEAHFEDLNGYLRLLKSEAEARSTTVRITLAGDTLSAFYFDTGGGATPPSTDCVGGNWIPYPDNVNPREVVIPVNEATVSGPSRLCFYRDSRASGVPNNSPYTYGVEHPDGPGGGGYQLQVNQPTGFMSRWQWNTQANTYYQM